ncbi:MAG TPA: RidA family protein [Phycisphaerae bacterium]|nr:RidA family protein [Phycisphaerae bacterium]
MSTPSQQLAALGLELPQVAAPVGSYVPAKRVGELVFTSGQIPVAGGKPTVTGKVGDAVSLAQAQEAAKLCALNALAAAAGVCGGLDRIVAIERVCVFVACVPAFTEQPKVANAASDLFFSVFGEAGRHVRSAVGVPVLPLDVPVELELIARIGS